MVLIVPVKVELFCDVFNGTVSVLIVKASVLLRRRHLHVIKNAGLQACVFI